MAYRNENRPNDHRRDRRRDYRRDEYYSQPEQFESGGYGQPDYREDRYGGSFADQMDEGRDYRDDYSEREYAREPRRDWRERESGRNAPAHHHSNFGPARFDTGEGRGFTSFTGSDQGGADFVAGNRRPYGGYGAGFGGMSAAYGSGTYDAAPHRGYSDDYRDRGFLERAGDEVASWFGDEDATRRRQQDHRGRGPTNYTRSDERILEDVCDTLTDDWDIDASDVQVSVQDGEVTLDGAVESRFDKRRAEDCADAVSGVRHVQNNLRINARGYRNENAGGAVGSGKTEV